MGDDSPDLGSLGLDGQDKTHDDNGYEQPGSTLDNSYDSGGDDHDSQYNTFNGVCREYGIEVETCAGWTFPLPSLMLWDKLKDMETVGDKWWPWDSEEEWEVVKWLSMTGLSKRAINEFLGLKYVCSVFTYAFANKLLTATIWNRSKIDLSASDQQTQCIRK